MNLSKSQLENMSINQIKCLLTDNKIPGRSRPRNKQEFVQFVLDWQKRNHPSEEEKPQNYGRDKREPQNYGEMQKYERLVQKESKIKEFFNECKNDDIIVPICFMEPDKIAESINISLIYIYLLEKHRKNIKILKTKRHHPTITFLKNETITIKGFSKIVKFLKTRNSTEGKKLGVCAISVSCESWKSSYTALLIFNIEHKKIELVDFYGYEELSIYLRDIFLNRYSLSDDEWRFSVLENKYEDKFLSTEGCNIWTVRMADLRFQNPSTTLKSLAKKLKLSLNQSHEEYIESYANFLMYKEEIFREDLMSNFFIKTGRHPSNKEIDTMIIGKLRHLTLRDQ